MKATCAEMSLKYYAGDESRYSALCIAKFLIGQIVTECLSKILELISKLQKVTSVTYGYNVYERTA